MIASSKPEAIRQARARAKVKAEGGAQVSVYLSAQAARHLQKALTVYPTKAAAISAALRKMASSAALRKMASRIPANPEPL